MSKHVWHQPAAAHSTPKRIKAQMKLQKCSECGKDLEKCEHGHKHTPIVSEKQRGLFGAELARRRAGEEGHMKGVQYDSRRGQVSLV